MLSAAKPNVAAAFNRPRPQRVQLGGRARTLSVPVQAGAIRDVGIAALLELIVHVVHRPIAHAGAALFEVARLRIFVEVEARIRFLEGPTELIYGFAFDLDEWAALLEHVYGGSRLALAGGTPTLSPLFKTRLAPFGIVEARLAPLIEDAAREFVIAGRGNGAGEVAVAGVASRDGRQSSPFRTAGKSNPIKTPTSRPPAPNSKPENPAVLGGVTGAGAPGPVALVKLEPPLAPWTAGRLAQSAANCEASGVPTTIDWLLSSLVAVAVGVAGTSVGVGFFFLSFGC